MFYTFEAEHIRNFKDLLQKILSLKGVSDAFGGRNAIFSSFHTITVVCSEKTASKVQDLIFEANDGAYCSFREFIEEDEDEEYFV